MNTENLNIDALRALIADEIDAARENILNVRTLCSRALKEARATKDAELPVKDLVKLVAAQVDSVSALDKLDGRLAEIEGRQRTYGEPIDFDAARQEIIEKLRRLSASEDS